MIRHERMTVSVYRLHSGRLWIRLDLINSGRLGLERLSDIGWGLITVRGLYLLDRGSLSSRDVLH